MKYAIMLTNDFGFILGVFFMEIQPSFELLQVKLQDYFQLIGVESATEGKETFQLIFLLYFKD